MSSPSATWSSPLPDPAPPPPPEAARLIDAAALPALIRYADLLAGDGVAHGHLGPREVPRLWERHLLNCAAVAELVPPGARLVDVGSGAGLPGVVLAVLRSDLQVVLLEPMARRVAFLQRCVATLELANTSVVRGRAEEPHGLSDGDVVTARAVSNLARLAEWTLPMLRPGGVLLAVKGESAAAELADADPLLRRLGAADAEVVRCGEGVLAVPTTVVRVRLGSRAPIRAERRAR